MDDREALQVAVRELIATHELQDITTRFPYYDYSALESGEGDVAVFLDANPTVTLSVVDMMTRNMQLQRRMRQTRVCGETRRKRAPHAGDDMGPMSVVATYKRPRARRAEPPPDAEDGGELLSIARELEQLTARLHEHIARAK